ncbi:hypothetical protein VNO77_18938 [Canavalia gladiata]|uniref:Uncharacterized protein n=1 Tax=Canavalia gladiata TaxID=3824 RepID=A0AAN9LQM3_CANGL
MVEIFIPYMEAVSWNPGCCCLFVLKVITYDTGVVIIVLKTKDTTPKISSSGYPSLKPLQDTPSVRVMLQVDSPRDNACHHSINVTSYCVLLPPECLPCIWVHPHAWKRMEIAAQCPPEEPDPLLFVSSRISLFSVGRRSKISFQRSSTRHSVTGILGKILG